MYLGNLNLLHEKIIEYPLAHSLTHSLPKKNNKYTKNQRHTYV